MRLHSCAQTAILPQASRMYTACIAQALCGKAVFVPAREVTKKKCQALCNMHAAETCLIGVADVFDEFAYG
jgi:hypothetical protein